MKRRFLRITLIVLALILFTGYFAFTTFLFNPLEGGYGADVATLVPRDVDFFTAKAELRRDFDEFPALAVKERMLESEGGRTLLESRQYLELLAEYEVHEALAGLQESLAELPLEVDPLDVFGGEDLAVAGYFRGAELEAADWAVYGRTSWMGKLALALLPYLDLASQGLELVEGAGSYSLSGGELARPIHFTRIRDVIVASTSAQLVADALELEAKVGEDSLHQSARYYDHIQSQKHRRPEDLEFFVDLRKMAEEFAWSGSWPDRESEEYPTALLGRLFQVGSLREIQGVLGFEGGPVLNAFGDLSTELIQDARVKRLHRMRDFDKSELRRVAAYAPADSYLFLYAVADIEDLLRTAYEALDKETRGLIDDTVRTVWGYPDSYRLIEEVSAIFRDRVAVVLLPRELPEDTSEDAPQSDGTPVFSWAVITWFDQNDEAKRNKITEIREKVNNNQRQFGIQGRDGRAGVYSNRVRSTVVFEFHIPLIAGTGHLATVTSGENFILSNSHLMLGEILDTYYGDASAAPLSERPEFISLSNQGLDDASIALWYSPRSASQFLRTVANFRVQDAVVINWDLERPRLERKVLEAEFGGRHPSSLSAGEQGRYETMVDEEVDRYEDEVMRTQIPILRRQREEAVVLQELVRAALVQLDLDQKSMEVFAKVLVPLDR